MEDGDTFAANAALKATQQARHLGQWVLADDSGLMVDALDGAPGVLSARYSGPGATDAGNNQKLLEALRDVPREKRSAQFVCHICLADPSGAIRGESAASCRGRILFAPSGGGGFGYDPLFEIVEYHRSFGELESAGQVPSQSSRPGRGADRSPPDPVDGSRRITPCKVRCRDLPSWSTTVPAACTTIFFWSPAPY